VHLVVLLVLPCARSSVRAVFRARGFPCARSGCGGSIRSAPTLTRCEPRRCAPSLLLRVRASLLEPPRPSLPSAFAGGEHEWMGSAGARRACTQSPLARRACAAGRACREGMDTRRRALRRSKRRGAPCRGSQRVRRWARSCGSSPDHAHRTKAPSTGPAPTKRTETRTNARRGPELRSDPRRRHSAFTGRGNGGMRRALRRSPRTRRANAPRAMSGAYRRHVPESDGCARASPPRARRSSRASSPRTPDRGRSTGSGSSARAG